MPLSTRVRRHLQTHVVGYLALFVALSGTALALPGHKQVKSDDLANGAVKGKAIAANAVSTGKLRENAVNTGKLAGAAVTAPKLAAGAVTTTAIGDGAVTAPKLANDSVARENIVQGTINGGKIANGAIDSPKVADGSLLATDFGAGQISDGFADSPLGNAVGPPSVSFQSVAYNAPRAGRLLLSSSMTANLVCPAVPDPECLTAIALYVDGTIVPESTREVSASAGTGFSEEVTSSGIASVSQGPHTIQVQTVIDTGAGSMSLGNLGTTGILLQ